MLAHALSPRTRNVSEAMASVARGLQVHTAQDAIMARNILEDMARESGDDRLDIHSSVQARMTEVLAANNFKDPRADIANTTDDLRAKPQDLTPVGKLLADRRLNPEEKAQKLRGLGAVAPAVATGMALASAMSRSPFESIDYTQDNAVSASFNSLSIDSSEMDLSKHMVCDMHNAFEPGHETCFHSNDLKGPLFTFNGPASLEPAIMLDDPGMAMPPAFRAPAFTPFGM